MNTLPASRFVRLMALLLCLASLFTVVALPVAADETSATSEEEPYPLLETSHMVGLKALFCGDSICMASTHDYKGQTRWGWAKRIGRAYGLDKSLNAGVDGASVSNCRGDNTIVRQLTANKFTKYDIVVLHGGTNDGWDNCPVGEITTDDCRQPKDFDVTTYAGGLENLFYTAFNLFPDAIICYIINFQTPERGIGTLNDMSAYYTVGKQICEKWGVPYLDLYFDEDFNQKTWMIKRQRFTVDKIHPNGKGYDVLYPIIGEFMDNLVVEKANAAEDPTSGDVTSEVTSGVTSEVPTEPEKPNDNGHTFLLIVGCAVAALFIATGVIVICRKKGKKQSEQAAKPEEKAE